jgi:iron complex outermembrane receptor protein
MDLLRRHARRPLLRPSWLACTALLLPLSATAAQGLEPDIADMSIEELANIQVTSVSRKPERLADAAASVFVITADDIRRSGAATLPEVLRLAPNLQVAQNSASGYAISARGLNGSNNSGPNKLLVLIDGRSVYAPLFSGVFWDAQDLVLEDIERIEVISGPGGTLWGVNAVNGVINITTRSAADTLGSLLALAGGQRGGDAAFRYGGAGGSNAHWRVYGKVQGAGHTELASGGKVDDAWRRAQLGFRADWGGGAERFSLNGAAYGGSLDQPKPGALAVDGTNLQLGTISTSGANLGGQWTHALDGGASLALQAYYDHTRREVPPTFAESLDLIDLQFQHSLAPAGAHSLVWGANYRYSWDRVTNSDIIAFLPARLNQTWASLFAQDEITLRDDLHLTVGSRLERNDYTGTEFLPTLRLAWKLAPSQSIWAGVSRTVRAPSRLDADAFVPGHPPFLLDGGRAVRSEVAKVFELGWRGQSGSTLSYSVTAFHNIYDHLRTQEIDPGWTFITFDNKMEGRASGIEMWGNLQAARNWRLSAGLMALHQRMTLKPDSNDLAGPGTAGKDPAATFQLRSSYDLSDDKQVDIGWRHVAALDNPALPAYGALDARFGWTLRRDLELSLVGRNLNGAHAEYGPLATRSEIPRSLGLRLVWQN